MTAHTLPRGIIYTARAEDVYPTLEPGSVSMVWSDGPYAVGKDTWDRMKPADLPAWYEPHIREWTRICAPSATIYHWGTADGWARVHPVYLREGWKFRTLITWLKPDSPAVIGWKAATSWIEMTEVCGAYTRGDATFNSPGVEAGNVWSHSCKALSLEQIKGERREHRLCPDTFVQASAHPCQKPLTFVRRAILASTRPGDIILDPFAGTCRVALVCEQLHANEARRHVSIEMDPAHVAAALKDIDQRTRQEVLF